MPEWQERHEAVGVEGVRTGSIRSLLVVLEITSNSIGMSATASAEAGVLCTLRSATTRAVKATAELGVHLIFAVGRADGGGWG